MAGGIEFEGACGPVGEEDMVAAEVGILEACGGEVVAVEGDELFEDVRGQESFCGGLEGVDGSPVSGVCGGFVIFEAAPIAPDGDVVVVGGEDGGVVGGEEMGEAIEVSAVEDIACVAGLLSGDVDCTWVGGVEAFSSELECEGDFLEGVVEAMEELGLVEGVCGVARGQFADAGDFPDEVDAVFGAGVVGLVDLGEFDGFGAPSFGEEVVEEFGVGSDDP